jgi:hypothetical protein
MNKKKFARFIQITLLLSIGLVGVVTYRAIKNDQVLNEEYDSNADCPSQLKRQCCNESYCKTPTTCPLMADECSSQNKIASCYQYSWKKQPQNETTWPCGSCNTFDNSEVISKEYKACKSQK